MVYPVKLRMHHGFLIRWLRLSSGDLFACQRHPFSRQMQFVPTESAELHRGESSCITPCNSVSSVVQESQGIVTHCTNKNSGVFTSDQITLP